MVAGGRTILRRVSPWLLWRRSQSAFFNDPTLHFYLCAALDYVWFLLSGSDSLENFVAYLWFVDGFDIIVLARALSTVMSVATVVVVWRIGLRPYGPVAGLGAALFLALCPFMCVSRIWPPPTRPPYCG
ncbi:MAG: hypothetical protein VCF24_24840 [Candidatus Latescibacterota bacterium]